MYFLHLHEFESRNKSTYFLKTNKFDISFSAIFGTVPKVITKFQSRLFEVLLKKIEVKSCIRLRDHLTKTNVAFDQIPKHFSAPVASTHCDYHRLPNRSPAGSNGTRVPNENACLGQIVINILCRKRRSSVKYTYY